MSHLPSNKQTVQTQDSVAIFCDFQNVSSVTGKADLLLNFAKIQGKISCKKFYYNSQHLNQVFAKNQLELLGFKCVDVPDNSKNSADYRLISDCIQLFAPKSSPNPNIIILVLGDWDFAGLISILQSTGKRVIVFAQRGSESPKLKNLVGSDNFHLIDELPQLVATQSQPQTNTNEHQISYNDAVEYLIEAIKTAINLGKGTGLGYINTLMRKRYPQYQCVTSISTPNGKQFKSFGQFVESVVNSGRIQKQNQELLLIE
jgi:uncharacterized LabA/DUF88 family protein